MRIILIAFLLISHSYLAEAQSKSEEVDLVNYIVASLIGEQDVEGIPVYSDMDHVCRSGYISCNDQNEVIGLDFAYSNLNGIIPLELAQLKRLRWIDLQFNYLAGTLPEGLANLKDLRKVGLRGNFITGPLPADLLALKSEAEFDLSENAMDIDDKELVFLLNIKDQVNLEGCRSPDSIYISDKMSTRLPEFSEIEILVDEVVAKEVIESIDKTEETKYNPGVEIMPRFPGCEDMDSDDAQKKRCADQKMLEFVYKRLKYPELARENGVEGMVVTQFVVLENGDIGSVKVVRDPGAKLGNSGRWVVNRMNYLCDPWSPGIQGGKAVKVLYTMPIKFKLQ